MKKIQAEEFRRDFVSGEWILVDLALLRDSGLLSRPMTKNRDGVTGFIVEPDEKSNLTNTSNLTKLAIKQKGIAGLVEAMGHVTEITRDACRSHVETNFSIGKMVTSYENCYKKILSH